VLAEELRRMVVGCSFFGPGHIDETVRAAESLLASYEGHPLAAAMAGIVLGGALAVQGDAERGRELVSAANEKRREAGLLVNAAGGSMAASRVELAAGDLEAAERILRQGLEELERLGGGTYYPTAALLLADVLEQRGRYDEASRLCPVIRETSDPNDLVNFIGVEALEGYLLAREGDVEGGERLVRRAVERAEGTDFYDQKGRAFELLAQTLALAENRPEALQAAQDALSIYEAKGDKAATKRARVLLASLSDGTAA
jgi:tetratricopeptide (TPR) repeat protein